MIKYRVNNKFVEEETFYTELKKYYDAVPQPSTYERCLELLNTNGCVRINGKGKTRTYEYHYFDRADEQVFELEQIVEETEFDPIDGDAFNIAFAVYQNGFRRN